MTQKIERTFTVAQPASHVWSYLSDFRSTNDWDPGTEQTTLASGDGGVGTVYENVSSFAGRKVEITYTVQALDPGRQITLLGESSSFTATDTITVEASGAGSTVTYEAEFEFHGLARLADPFMSLPLKKLGDDARKSLKETLESL